VSATATALDPSTWIQIYGALFSYATGLLVAGVDLNLPGGAEVSAAAKLEASRKAAVPPEGGTVTLP